MPYTESNAPAHVKKMPAKRKRQWLHVFNSSINGGDSESTAFAKANGVTNKEIVEEKTYVESWDVANRRLSKSESNYSILGGLDGKEACAACRWFVSPDACVIVSGDISPVGTCDRYEPVQADVYQEENIPIGAMPVYQVNEVEKPMSIFDRFFGNGKEQGNFVTIKQVDGSTRFFVLASNNFKDRHKEIITEAAHKEFVGWCDSQKAYPELWLWHAKDSTVGVVDWIDCCDGMLVASGKLNEWAEPLVSKWKDLGVSHGFLGVTTKDGYVTNYRSYEISLLPRDKAANPITGVDFIGEVSMPFSEAKKNWLKEQVGDPALVDTWETNTDALAKQFKDLGIEFKETKEPEIAAGNETMIAMMAEMAAGMKDLAAMVVETKKSLDERVEEALTPRVKDVETQTKFVASEKDDNAPGAELVQQVAAGGDSWFNKIVMEGINGRS